MATPCSVFEAPELLIFDLDGTLIDSKRDIVECVNRAFSQLGYREQPGELIASQVGRGAELLFKGLLGPRLPESAIKELVASFKGHYEKHLLDHTTLYPDIEEVLTHYGAVRKVVVTNKAQPFANRIVAGLGVAKHFEGVYGSEAFATQKPDPGPIIEVCRRWHAHPAKTAVIGDSEFDLLAGKRAGACTVAVLYGFGSPESLRTLNPDFIVAKARELIELGESARQTRQP